MHYPTFALNIRIERPGQTFLEFRPPHVWGLLASIKQASDDLVSFADINGMYTDSFIVLNQALKGLASIIWAL
jgi:hypothetical protein